MPGTRMSSTKGLSPSACSSPPWRAIDRRSVQAIDLKVAEVDLDDAKAARLGIQGVRGKIAALVHVEPRAER